MTATEAGGRLRVATVITRFNGGAGLVALNGALALDPRDYELTVVTGGTGMDSTAATAAGADRDAVLRGRAAVAAAAAGDLTPRAHQAGIHVVQVRSLVPQISPRDDLAALRTLTEVLAEGEYDVVHTHSAKGGFLGRLAAARAGVPRIVHTWHGFPFSEFHSRLRRGAYVAMERRAARHTDAFLAIGTETANDALRTGLASADRVRMCWPAVDVSPYALPGEPGEPVRERARGLAGERGRALLDLPPGARVVGSVGRVTEQKGPDVFVRALARLPRDVVGVWIGGGPLKERMTELTRRLGVSGRMRWLGHRDDVADLLPAFDVMAMASRWEGLPCVLVEAIAAGVPLVATAVPSNHDLVLSGESGLLVPPQDPAQLAGAVAHLLDHPEVARRLARRAGEMVGDRFTPWYLAAILDDTYRGTSRRPARRPARREEPGRPPVTAARA